MELQTLEGADKIFGFMEDHLERFKRVSSYFVFFWFLAIDSVAHHAYIYQDVEQHKGLTLLRICNELSRRAPKSTHSVLRGRISIFLTMVFPLTDRSGVNLRGDYNTANVTYFEESDEEDQGEQAEGQGPGGETEAVKESAIEADASKKAEKLDEPKEGGDKMDVDSGKPAEDKSKPPDPKEEKATPKGPREPSFYTIFWTLQRFLSNPPLLFDASLASFLPPGTHDTPTNLSFLRFAVKRTLDRFSEMSKRERELAGAAAKGKKASVDADEDIDDVKKRYFFPKFLTSRTLLDQEVLIKISFDVAQVYL
jgi:THO complex subunit 1